MQLEGERRRGQSDDLLIRRICIVYYRAVSEETFSIHI